MKCRNVPKEPIISKKHFMREVPESECLTELNEIEINEKKELNDFIGTLKSRVSN